MINEGFGNAVTKASVEDELLQVKKKNVGGNSEITFGGENSNIEWHVLITLAVRIKD